MAELITQSEFARRKGCSRQHVSTLVSQGRITLVDGRIDPALVERELAEHADPARAHLKEGQTRNPEIPKGKCLVTVGPTYAEEGARCLPSL